MSILNGKQDVYLEIAKRYEKFITLGVLKDGEKLPSVRTAASELSVNPNTVQRAYSHLESLGFIRTIPKKGVFVTYRGDTSSSDFDDRKAKAFAILNELRESGITKNEIFEILKEVYEK